VAVTARQNRVRASCDRGPSFWRRMRIGLAPKSCWRKHNSAPCSCRVALLPCCDASCLRTRSRTRGRQPNAPGAQPAAPLHVPKPRCCVHAMPKELLQLRASARGAVGCSGLLGSGYPPVDSSTTFVSLDAVPAAEPLVPKHSTAEIECCPFAPRDGAEQAILGRAARGARPPCTQTCASGDRRS